MKPVTVYEVTEKQVIVSGDYLEICHYSAEQPLMVRGSDEFYASYDKIHLPVKKICKHGQEPRYVAISREAEEVFGISERRVEELEGQIKKDGELIERLTEGLDSWNSESWKGHLKWAWVKFWRKVK